MIRTIMAMVTKIPIPNPALKIPSITAQLVSEIEANRSSKMFFILFFMLI